MAAPVSLSTARRAAPRLCLAAAALVGVVVSRTSWTVALWAVVLIAVAAPLLTSRGWQRVRTGAAPPSHGSLDELPSGTWRLLLLSAGERPVPVIKTLRELTGVDLVTAKRLVDEAPGEVARGLSELAARRGTELLDRAGATAAAEPLEAHR